MSDYLETKSSLSFRTNMITLSAFADVLRSDPESFGFTFWGPREIFRQALQYGNDALAEDSQAAFAEINNLGLWAHSDVAEKFWKVEPDGQLGLMFREEVLKAGIAEFVHAKLRDSATYFDGLSGSPLKVILREANLGPQHLRIMESIIKADRAMKVHEPVGNMCFCDCCTVEYPEKGEANHYCSATYRRDSMGPCTAYSSIT
ncbi:uncharacterized protein B0I36DRAFT_117447 [Microdochium trichocladiopsis]|uniref:Uncharacterized protein n=1 Tax=Microdochium trichocladiopsis TaxID=1682393 RepID=A0A9P8Y6D7_9PEZI|nr:uncharacterized protein B0I36DRAFT_117447 [Microdochium trichocladiopsis]KAH7031000.1 hypothetical protein B0I36DRAFT_117447 [Microdochium trichocladiopsis]